jgi:hypothetical protein
MQTLEAAVGGACFGPSRCTLFPSGYTWQDVVGYDLILFIAKGIQMPGQPARPANAFPARIFIVNPDSGKNEALSVQPSRSETWSLPDLLAQIRSAPTASH